MRQTFEKSIDGVRFRATAYGARDGLLIMGRLSDLMSGPVGTLVSAVLSGKSLAELFDSDTGDLADMDFGPAIETLLARFGDPSIPELAIDIVKHCEVFENGVVSAQLGVPDAFDDFFAGKYDLLGKVLLWLVEVNFSVVFRSLKSGVKSMTSVPAEANPDQT